MNLSEAIRADNTECVAELIKDWSDIDRDVVVNGDSRSLLWCCVIDRRERVTRYLLSRGANVEKRFDGVSIRELALTSPVILKVF